MATPGYLRGRRSVFISATSFPKLSSLLKSRRPNAAAIYDVSQLESALSDALLGVAYLNGWTDFKTARNGIEGELAFIFFSLYTP